MINTGRRRRFTEDEKLRIIAGSFAGRGRASATARQYGISCSLLNGWRKSVRQGLPGQKQTDGFVPAFVRPETFVPVKQVIPPAAMEHPVTCAARTASRTQSFYKSNARRAAWPYRMRAS
ncbi:transposase [Sinorhizobium meliloti]|uniref:transposase n=1 Tax=Rhizobium meliloti TaxID=382 RepID=UPI003F5CD73C